MKKMVLIVAIILGMTIGANAQSGGLFGKGPERQQESNDYATRGALDGLPLSVVFQTSFNLFSG